MTVHEKGYFNYLIIDSALADIQLNVAQRLNPLNVSLYKDTPDEPANAVAPYLFSINADDKFFLNWVEQNCWGKNWSIFISANISLHELAKHLKKFLVVKNEKRKEMYFRFYDPRVLQVFLPTCNADQLADFFGPVHSFVMEDEMDTMFARIFKLENNRLAPNKIGIDTLFGREIPAATATKGAEDRNKPRHKSFIIKKNEP